MDWITGVLAPPLDFWRSFLAVAVATLYTILARRVPKEMPPTGLLSTAKQVPVSYRPPKNRLAVEE